jgi:hypothetical protein
MVHAAGLRGNPEKYVPNIQVHSGARIKARLKACLILVVLVVEVIKMDTTLAQTLVWIPFLLFIANGEKVPAGAGII